MFWFALQKDSCQRETDNLHVWSAEPYSDVSGTRAAKSSWLWNVRKFEVILNSCSPVTWPDSDSSRIQLTFVRVLFFTSFSVWLSSLSLTAHYPMFLWEWVRWLSLARLSLRKCGRCRFQLRGLGVVQRQISDPPSRALSALLLLLTHVVDGESHQTCGQAQCFNSYRQNVWICPFFPLKLSLSINDKISWHFQMDWIWLFNNVVPCKQICHMSN